jgi:hypothetical protein
MGLAAGSASAMLAYLALQRPAELWALAIPIGVAGMAVLLMLPIARRLQPEDVGDALRTG